MLSDSIEIHSQATPLALNHARCPSIAPTPDCFGSLLTLTTDISKTRAPPPAPPLPLLPGTSPQASRLIIPFIL